MKNKRSQYCLINLKKKNATTTIEAMLEIMTGIDMVNAVDPASLGGLLRSVKTYEKYIECRLALWNYTFHYRNRDGDNTLFERELSSWKVECFRVIQSRNGHFEFELPDTPCV